MKTIAFLANTSFNLYNFRLPLMKALKEKGYKVYAIAPKDSYTPLLEKEGFPYVEIKKLENKSRNPIKDFFFFKEIFQIYRNIKPSLAVHITIKPNVYGNLAAGLLNIPVVSLITGLGHIFLSSSLNKFLGISLYKISLRYAQKVIFQNKEDLNLFLRYKIIPSSKANLIPGSGVDTTYFHPQICEKFSLNSSPKTIFLFIGRLLREKGIYELISAGKKLRKFHNNFEIHILGKIDKNNPSSIAPSLLEEWKKLDFVKFLGYEKDIRKYLCQADWVVLPSYREGLSRVLLEAMAMGKPIITTNVPGCKELIINGENGFIVEVKNPEELYEAMRKALQIPSAQRIKMGLLSRKLVEENYSIPKVIPQYLKILEEILSQRPV